MVGIVRFGAYVPLHRMGKDTEAWTGQGERAIASFDEDSITMAVAAGLDCLNGIDTNEIDVLYFASTTSPYREKQSSTLVAKAVDLRDDIFTADFAGSLRAGTSALKAAWDSIKAGTSKSAMVTVADERVPQPRSEFDFNIGDGAAAFILGNEDVVAEIEDFYSLSHEIYDVWRADTDVFPRSSEDRFISDEGYTKMKKAGIDIMARNGLSPGDFARLVIYGPNARRHAEICKSLGFDNKTQLSSSFFGQMGDTGCAFVPMMLVGALEEAKPGERILAISYGEGADAVILRTTDAIDEVDGRRGIKGYLNSKKILPSYMNYLKWRGLVSMAHAAKRPPRKVPGTHAIHREASRNISLYGVKCLNCGTVQYPDERVCTNCQAKDQMTPYKIPKQGTLFTYSMDYIGQTLEPPLIVSIMDFDGGGRGMFTMTDRDTTDIRVGMPLELSFRRLHSVEGIHNYYWCTVPYRG